MIESPEIKNGSGGNVNLEKDTKGVESGAIDEFSAEISR
jgi:hypothetical protein